MTDLALRTLERTYNEAPDLATGVAYFRALERVGKATKKQSQTLALLEKPPNQTDLVLAFDLGWQPAVVVRHLCEGVTEPPEDPLAWLDDTKRWAAINRLSIRKCKNFDTRLRGSSTTIAQWEMLRYAAFELAGYRLWVRQSPAEISLQRDLFCECLFDLA